MSIIGRFLCWIGWHKPYVNVGFDGCSVTGKCCRCGDKLLLDSQGNWFSIGNDTP